MLNALSSARAAALGLALGLSIGAASSAAHYIKGRVDGWARADAAADKAALDGVRKDMRRFLADLARNTGEGDQARAEIAGVGDTIGGLRNEIASLADRLDCPADPRVSVRADQARDAAAAAIDRAAGSRAYDPAQRRVPAGPAAAGDPPGL